MRLSRMVVLPFLGVLVLAPCAPAAAQGFGASTFKPRPWSRISFFSNTARTTPDEGPARDWREMSTAFSYQLPESDEAGLDYGVDARASMYPQGERPDRIALYEAFAGARVLDGRLRARVGHVWMTELGSLGSVAGAIAEYRQRRATETSGRFRAGVFGGLEPNIIAAGYAPDVKKYGAYAAYDGVGAQRHAVGYVQIRNGALTERSALTTTNFLPLAKGRVFIYQAAEFNVAQPAGLGRSGLAYFFTNVRAIPHPRLELQGTYNRGRSIDARGLGQDVLSGRTVARTSIDGLQFESAGGRVTAEVWTRVRVYAGYSRDRTNREADPTYRLIVGGIATNLGGSGFDITASDSLMDRATGSFHSRYVSVGHSLGRRVYLIGDYSNSVSLMQYSRSDGLLIEIRPRTTRISGTVTANLTRVISLLSTYERLAETDLGENRLLAGLTYRIR